MSKGLDLSYQDQSNIENTYISTTLLIMSVGWFFGFYDFWLQSFKHIKIQRTFISDFSKKSTYKAFNFDSIEFHNKITSSLGFLMLLFKG
jgi:uncharacterized membrane protein SpoIIM required for sporulation